MDPFSVQFVPGGVAEVAKQALINMGEILKAESCDYTIVVFVGWQMTLVMSMKPTKSILKVIFLLQLLTGLLLCSKEAEMRLQQ